MRLLDERGEILRLFHVLNLAHQGMSPDSCNTNVRSGRWCSPATCEFTPAGVSAVRSLSRVERGYPYIAMSEPTPTVLPDHPLEPRRPSEPPTVDIPEPPDPADPWNEPEPPEPPEPGRPLDLPPEDDP